MYLSCKMDYCSDAFGIPLIHLNMVTSIYAEISVQDSFRRQDYTKNHINLSFESNNHQ